MSLRQEAETLFFGSGVQELYDHWLWSDKGSMFTRFGDWEPGQAPDTWAYRVYAPNPLDSERRIEKVVTYSVLYTAAELITEEKVDVEKPFHPPGAETDRACSMWVYSDELGTFDPYTLDQVLQVAVFGGVRYPHFEPRNRG